jgi:hypothetical protein
MSWPPPVGPISAQVNFLANGLVFGGKLRGTSTKRSSQGLPKLNEAEVTLNYVIVLEAGGKVKVVVAPELSGERSQSSKITVGFKTTKGGVAFQEKDYV